MSGRGGIYRGPDGEQLYGDGRLVELSRAIGPPVRQLESYPLGDFLYDRAKAANDLNLFYRSWERFQFTLPVDWQEAITKINRISRKKVPEGA